MAKFIKLSTPDTGVTNGMELSFRAPCNCSGITGISLDGKIYSLVDASRLTLAGCGDYFEQGAILSVIIDTVNNTATLLNPRVNTYTKSLGTPNDTANANGTTVWARVKQVEQSLANTALVPELTLNTERKLTESGYYFIGHASEGTSQISDCIAIYWQKGLQERRVLWIDVLSGSFLNAKIQKMDLVIESDGTIKYLYTNSEEELNDIEFENIVYYTAKIPSASPS